jgi:hypothetical protein
MVSLSGGCYCGSIRYQISLDSLDDARTSLCHCKNCKKFFGSAFGLTAKIPDSAFEVTQGTPKVHEADNGTGTMLHREFCAECGSGLLEYAMPQKGSTYIAVGTLDEPGKLPPKGEFFTKRREEWMPEVPGCFQKREIKE